MMLPIVLPLPSTSISFGTGALCFAAHVGSASMASGFRFGILPSYVTVPLMVAPAHASDAIGREAKRPRARLRPNILERPDMLSSYLEVEKVKLGRLWLKRFRTKA